ncbi:DUF5959 family protein [Streptomyces sp. HPF1205]|uniref:DUF5959 family protein n=1 Tax=Streptomyces sp. HPF1205 TaxID=2873262 RepID=UPI001CEDC3B0|nr:DUF5959 family protein [Streptomyces sp. HPF1205]
MAGEGAGEFIRLVGDSGSVTVLITGRAEGAALAAQVVVDTPFVQGSATMSLVPADLAEWQDALDALDTGKDVAWLEGERAAGLVVEVEPGPGGGRAHVTVAGDAASPVTVALDVTLTDAWFDDAYHRLDEARRTYCG